MFNMLLMSLSHFFPNYVCVIMKMCITQNLSLTTFHHLIQVMYGMTETSPVTFLCFPSDSREIRSSTIGYPADHIEVRFFAVFGEVILSTLQLMV